MLWLVLAWEAGRGFTCELVFVTKFDNIRVGFRVLDVLCDSKWELVRMK
jgi:hypothetical protein